MHIWALVLAAGSGTRLAHAGGPPKQFLPYRGLPLFWHSALTLARLPALRGIVFVLPHDREWLTRVSLPTGADAVPLVSSGEDREEEPAAQACRAYVAALARMTGLGVAWRAVPGGTRRQDSVALGLAALPAACRAVLVHDGARPFATTALNAALAAALEAGHPAVIPGVPVTDTVKRVDADGLVLETPDRSTLRAVQTPQGFLLDPLRKAHALAARQGWEVTDDASLMERCGHPVLVLAGEESNHKITTPGDLALLAPVSTDPMDSIFAATGGLLPCTGLGYDVHRYGGDRPFILGGVPIPCAVRVAAHSDGDTLLHALMDAILGCLGLGDIGVLFPDTDPALEDIPSGILLAEVLERADLAGLVLTHVDVTIIAQTPRIAPHRQAIAANLAKLLHLDPKSVNVKATTEEGLGFTGEKKGIKVLAQVSALKPVKGPGPHTGRHPGMQTRPHIGLDAPPQGGSRGEAAAYPPISGVGHPGGGGHGP